MSGIQSKTLKNSKNQQNLNHNAGKNKTIDINLELTQILEMVYKDMEPSL